MEKIACELGSIDEMQFGFVPSRETTVAFTFVDLEKAFDCASRDILWWAMQHLGLPEWLVNTDQAMYTYTSSRVQVQNSLSDSFRVQVGVHQGSILTPLLFIIVLDTFSRKSHTGCLWDLLYDND